MEDAEGCDELWPQNPSHFYTRTFASCRPRSRAKAKPAPRSFASSWLCWTERSAGVATANARYAIVITARQHPGEVVGPGYLGESIRTGDIMGLCASNFRQRQRQDAFQHCLRSWAVQGLLRFLLGPTPAACRLRGVPSILTIEAKGKETEHAFRRIAFTAR